MKMISKLCIIHAFLHFFHHFSKKNSLAFVAIMRCLIFKMVSLACTVIIISHKWFIVYAYFRKYLCSEIIFAQKLFSDINYFWPRNCFHENFVWTNLFSFLYQKCFYPITFFDQKIFYPNNFLTKSNNRLSKSAAINLTSTGPMYTSLVFNVIMCISWITFSLFAADCKILPLS